MSEDGSYAKYMVKGSTVVFISKAVTAVMGIVLRMLLGRTLSPEDYGLFYAVFAFISFFTMFRDLGLSGAIAKHLPEFRSEGKLKDIKASLFTTLIIKTFLTVSVAILFVVLSDWLSSSFFGTGLARPIIIILAAYFSIHMLLQFLGTTFRGFRDMVGRSIGEPSRVAFTLVLVAILVLFFEANLNQIAIAFLLGVIFATLLSFVLLRIRHFHLIRGERSLDWQLARKLFAFGLPLFLAGAAGIIMTRTDTLMITALRSLKDVGLYQAAWPAYRFLGFFGIALATPTLPLVSELWAKDKKESIRSLLYFLSKFSLILMIPIVLIFLAFPETIIKILFGVKYLEAAAALQILSIASVFWAGASIFGPTVVGIGHPTFHLKAMGVGALFNVPANLLLVPPFGAGGAAIATCLSYLIVLIALFFYQRKITGFPVPISSILKTVAGGGITLLMIWVLKSVLVLPFWSELFVVVVPSAIFYTLWVFRTGTITEEDLDTLSRAVPIPERLIKVLKKILV